ncbi:MAG: M10 family metallopeptidase C-terminal domain-containing protein, partial [Novosphingobium sp.]
MSRYQEGELIMALYNENAPTALFTPTGNIFIDALAYRGAGYWSTVVNGTTAITYSFPYLNGGTPLFATQYVDEPFATRHFGVTTAQADAIDLAFQRWADVANITFTRVDETADGVVGDIRMAFSSTVNDELAAAYAYYPSGGDALSGDVWFNTQFETSTFQPLTYAFFVMMHELGHALGLKHPFDYSPNLPIELDQEQYTVMSYTSPRNVRGSDPATYIINTPGVYDIAAIQAIYGANMSFHTGDDVYAYAPDKPLYESIWDAGGIDTIDVSAFTRDCSISLVPGTYSLLGYAIPLDPNIGIAFQCTIENATGGSGNDLITGNAADNVLTGNGGDDTLDGGAGSDTASYASASAPVAVSLLLSGAQATGGAGSDTLISIENLVGSALADTLTGDANANVIDGGNGSDTINGGDGSDTASYASASGPVAVSLLLSGAQATGGAGSDTLTSIENLIGSASADTLTGDANANVIEGGKGADKIDGGDGSDTVSYASANGAVAVVLLPGFNYATGAADQDTLISIENVIGSAFDDQLYGSNGANVLNGGNGSDYAVYAGAGGSVTVSLLISGAQATGVAGLDTLISIENLVGSPFADTLIGDGNANVLYDFTAASAADVLSGGGGSDTYYVHNSAANVIEGVNDGSADVVISSVTYDLTGRSVETLRLTGSGAISATGNDMANALYGNDGVNTLTGLGGADTLDGGKSADTMTGGTGDDTYTVDNTGDRTIETFGQGTDTVYSTVSYNLGGIFIEKLVLTGAAAINATGNSQINTLIGNDADNTLTGLGGNDVLDGGNGFDTAIGGSGDDTY